MSRPFNICSIAMAAGVGAVLTLAFATPSQAAWEPTRPVEFIIPAGTGGGADIMARTIQGIVSKHNLMKQPLLPINKAEGAGGVGFLDMKGSKDPHKIIITLSNLFTTPLATGIPFNWKELTPVAMLALDEFVLWVNAEKPYKNVKEFIDAAKAANGGFKMAGTGSKQEDEIITQAIQKSSGAKFIYIPEKGGGAVAVQLVGNHVELDGEQSERSRFALARRQAPSALRVRRQSDAVQRADRGRQVLGGYSNLQVAGAQHGISDAPRHLHDAGRQQGCGRLLHRRLQEGP